MAITLSNAFTDNLLWTGTQGVATQIGGGTLVVFASGGSPPPGPNEVATGTTLATFTFSSAALQNGGSAPTAGSINLVFSNQTVTAGASGTADYFRVISSGAVALIQGTVGTSGADWNLSSTTITTGDQVSITGTATISWVTS